MNSYGQKKKKRNEIEMTLMKNTCKIVMIAECTGRCHCFGGRETGEMIEWRSKAFNVLACLVDEVIADGESVFIITILGMVGQVISEGPMMTSGSITVMPNDGSLSAMNHQAASSESFVQAL